MLHSCYMLNCAKNRVVKKLFTIVILYANINNCNIISLVSWSQFWPSRGTDTIVKLRGIATPFSVVVASVMGRSCGV